MQGAKRNLVRWTGKTSASAAGLKISWVNLADDLDKKLLLCIQFACSEAGLRIPWENVAKLMGEKVSEGAIVQHLAKLRSKMLELRLDVPPPLKRIPATAPSKIYAESGNNRGRPVPSVTASVAKPATAARRTGKKKTRARRSGLNSDSDSQSDVKNMEIADDTDDEWGTVSDRKRRKLKGKQRQLAEPEAFHEPAPELTVDHTNDISTRQSPPPHEQTAQFALRRQLAGGTRQLGSKHDSAKYNGNQNTRESGSSETSDIDAATPKMNAMVTRAADSGDGVEQVTTSNVRTFGRPQLTNSPTRDIERRVCSFTTRHVHKFAHENTGIRSCSEYPHEGCLSSPFRQPSVSTKWARFNRACGTKGPYKYALDLIAELELV